MTIIQGSKISPLDPTATDLYIARSTIGFAERLRADC